MLLPASISMTPSTCVCVFFYLWTINLLLFFPEVQFITQLHHFMDFCCCVFLWTKMLVILRLSLRHHWQGTLKGANLLMFTVWYFRFSFIIFNILNMDTRCKQAFPFNFIIIIIYIFGHICCYTQTKHIKMYPNTASVSYSSFTITWHLPFCH